MASWPNILWLSFEDTSPRFGCYGDPIAQTPHVDRLAAEGCVYPNLFATVPVCAPNRFSIITGLYPVSAGAMHHRTHRTQESMPELATPYHAVAPHYARCIPEYLRRVGYYCTNNVKTDYQFAQPPSAWDRCERGAHWRDRPDPDQPFFAVFNLDATHESGQWPSKGGEPRTDPGTVTLPPYLPDTPACRKALARQYDHIADNDAIVGQVLAELEADGLAEDTAVFIWSDHGEGLPRGKRWLYDSGTRVPLIVRWPGEIEPGTIDRRMVSSIDLGPTVLSMCGLEVPWHLQGMPFVGPEAREREYCYSTRDRLDTAYDMCRSVRDRRYRYIRNLTPHVPRMHWVPYRNRHPVQQEVWKRYIAGTLEGPQRWFAASSRPVEELYDCEADPHEIHNLADDPAYADVIERLSESLDDWRDEVGDMGEVDEAIIRQRFWPNGEQPVTGRVIFIPIGGEHTGVTATTGEVAYVPTSDRHTAVKEVATSEMQVVGPMVVQLHTPTQGGSIVYTLESGDDPHWRLYVEPIRLEAGTHTIRARACRIGYADSDERSATFIVT